MYKVATMLMYQYGKFCVKLYHRKSDYLTIIGALQN